MSAITLVGHLLPRGARIVAPHDCYGGTFRLFTAWQHARRARGRVRELQRRGARFAALSPSRPRCCGSRRRAIRCCASRTSRDRERWARAGALVVVDNTFLSPAWQQPLKLGADIVVHSTTKYINGHSDVVGGAVVARDKALHEQLVWWAQLPRRHWRAVRQLPHAARPAHAARAPARARPQCAGTRAMAARSSRASKKVYYPGLPAHPGHEIAKRQQSGFRRDRHARARRAARRRVRAFVEGLECFSLAESLGGVESLVAHPGDDDACGDGSRARARRRGSSMACCVCRSASRRSKTCCGISRRRERAAAESAARPRQLDSATQPFSQRREHGVAHCGVASERSCRARRCRPCARRRRCAAPTAASTAAPRLEPERVAQQHRDAEDRADGIRDALAGDVGRGAVDRLVEPAPCRRRATPTASMPSEPASIDASSVRMSPNMFSVTMTSKSRGRRMRCIAAASTSMCSSATSGNSALHRRARPLRATGARSRARWTCRST